jgi:hypothetical protein
MHELSILTLLSNILQSPKDQRIATRCVDTHVLELGARSNQVNTQCWGQTLQT